MTARVPGFAKEFARGADMSEWNGHYEPKIPLDFVLQRVSQASPGGVKLDQRLEELYADCATVPEMGGWHFWSGFKPTQEQIDIYLRGVQGKRYVVHALDWEERNSRGEIINPFTKASAEEAGKWMRAIAQATGKKVLLYIQRSDYKQLVSFSVSWLNEFDLWAKYWILNPYLDTATLKGIAFSFRIPVERIRFLQFGGDSGDVQGRGQGREYGTPQAASIDVDIYPGTLSQLRAEFGTGGPTPDPELPPDQEPLTLEQRVARLEVLAQQHGWEL